MMEYQYFLDKSSKKFNCPRCMKRRFVRYCDSNKHEYIDPKFGRCDRESKCAYHLNPYSERKLQNNYSSSNKQALKPIITKKSLEFFQKQELDKTLNSYNENVLIQNLLKNVQYPFKICDVERIIELYYLGTISEGYRKGAITFPFIDVHENIRTVQVKQFNKENKTIGTDFLHSIIEKEHKNIDLPQWLKLYLKNEKKVSCFFGEHLLKRFPHNPIALVEAPKTAIYGTLYFGFPEDKSDLIWLAVYNLSSFSIDKSINLKGRDVYLFPDLSENKRAYNLWERKSKEIEKAISGTRFVISDLLEIHSDKFSKEEGYDLADFLINMDWRDFRKQSVVKETPQEKIIVEHKVKSRAVNIFSEEFLKTSKPENIKWELEIKELINFFNKIELPKGQIIINDWTKINNLKKYVSNHFKVIESNKGNPTFYQYLDRLKKLKEHLSSK